MTEEEAILTGRYLRDELNSSELTAFNERMQQDGDFRRGVLLEKEVMKAIVTDGTDEFKKNLEAVRREQVEPSANDRLRSRRFLKVRYQVAAVIALTVVSAIAVFYFTRPEKPGSEALFAAYYVQPFPENTRTGKNDRQIADDAYLNHDYQKALNHFRDNLSEHPAQMSNWFFIGHCYLQLNDAPHAITAFEKIIAHGNNIYIQEARWFLALAYLKNGDIPRARETLKQWPANHKYYEKSRQLLKDLRQLG